MKNSRAVLLPPLLLLVALLHFVAPPAHSQTVLPAGFQDSLVVGGLDLPTAFDFVPGSTAGRWRLVFVQQSSARMRLVVQGALSGTDPVLTVPNVNTSGSERGLLGVALDPGFPARPYVYVHANDNRSAHIRISRFTLSGDLAFTANGAMTADPVSRFDLVADIPDNAFNHNGGTVRFGPDGMLYVSLGDDASECGAQDSVTLRGVILRLRVDALPAGPGRALRSQVTPADNPYATHPDSNARIVWAMGLRNPFRFQIDPPTGRLVIADVGQGEWEEVNIASGGGQNFGWPFLEGNTPFTSCARSSAGIVAPVAVYSHAVGISVMSAGIYRPVAGGSASWPAAYDGDLFYSDYYSGILRRLHFDGVSWTSESAPGQPTASDWALGFDAVTDYRVGPDGALWFLRQWGSVVDGQGEIRRVVPAAVVADAPPSRGDALALRVWPTPGRGALSFEWAQPADARATLAIYDVRGRLVRRLMHQVSPAPGRTQVSWDGLDAGGAVTPAGLYWARLDAGAVSRSVRFTRLP